MRFSVSTRALMRELDGEAVLLHLDSGMYYGLNAMGTWIWKQASRADGLAFETLVTELVTEFDVERSTAEREANRRETTHPGGQKSPNPPG